jgi:hypothetical protein
MANGEHKKTQPNNKNLFMGGLQKKEHVSKLEYANAFIETSQIIRPLHAGVVCHVAGGGF